MVVTYVLAVKGNQKTLRRTLKALPWKAPHLRLERRALSRSAGTAHRRGPQVGGLPRGRPGGPVRRTRTTGNRKARTAKATSRSVEVVYRVCSLPITDAQPEAVAAWVRGHWGIENRLHWVRDVVFDQGTATSCASATAPRSWPPCVTWPPGLIRLAYGTRAAIASTTRSLSRRPNELSDY